MSSSIATLRESLLCLGVVELELASIVFTNRTEFYIKQGIPLVSRSAHFNSRSTSAYICDAFRKKKISVMFYCASLLRSSSRATHLQRTTFDISEDVKCGKNISDTLSYRLVYHSLFLPHFNVICDLQWNPPITKSPGTEKNVRYSGIFVTAKTPL